ncbi:ComE operon protein 2 [Abyssicoccus albus]|uniref:ComE operon protein 2 n=1 Tax=Abyssicoccus albus TaxID=1817405 RepID=A0A3N5BJV6_9BACL|nr:ComE operon protein 2 [Abyssicoccus albus]RPF58154.1 dCMP deaminase [Abyssicoccus albus]
MNRLQWDEYFMAQAKLLATRSTCTRLSVGAIIVKDKRVIASGYNGSVSGDEHCTDVGCLIEGGHCIRTIHAEMNAIIQCSKMGVETNGAHIYVSHFPCIHCTKSIIQAGIKKVYYAENYKNHPYAIELFKKNDVEMVHIPYDREKMLKTFSDIT